MEDPKTLPRRSKDDDDKHEKAANQFGELELGPTVGETYTCLSAMVIATCCSGANVFARNVFMCFQSQPSRAYFLWALLLTLTGFGLWFLSWDTARRALMLSKWSWWSHIALPLMGMAVGMFGSYDVTDGELRDEAFAANSRANCDRMMWRRGLAAAGVLIMLATAIFVCNSVWFYDHDEDIEFLQEHRGHHKSIPLPSPSPSAQPSDSGLVPSWMKTQSPTRIPLPTPSPSMDPTVVIRLEQIERNKKAEVGMFFLGAMTSLSLALVCNWRRQTVPHIEDTEYDPAEGLFSTSDCCVRMTRTRSL